MDVPRAAAGVAVSAADFGLKGPRGWAFRGVGFDAEPCSLIAVEGPSGSGRTSLLLALTGRMKPSEGRATVGGHPLPKDMSAVRRISALAHVPGVTDLEPALTVGEHLRERALLESRFRDSLRSLLRPRGMGVPPARAKSRAWGSTAEAGRRIDTALAAAGLDPEALPKGSRTAVSDLERLEGLRLSVALALIGRPRLLAVDDTDLKLSAAERAEVWGLLRSLAEAGTTVLAVCAEAPEGAVVVSTAPVKDVREEATAGDAAGEATPEGPSEDGGDDDKETADALAETGRA
ncbi:ATP-binding cassette domain-containing protein [Streptomyces sp. NPDC001795]|uniref:ATP-binding cassette domain-containing protein n=1 Tax=Streptomyces sp. NPDC001795 TaxID=3154525 RepID=UPI003330BE48